MRVCIFCGGGPLTLEHVWPAWLIALFPALPSTITFRGRERQATTSDELTVRAVCEKCNGGWMSDLEQQAKPLLMELLEERPYSFMPPGMQDVISAWAVKTVMVFEHVLGPDAGVYYTQEERVAFRIPPHVPP